MTNIRKSASEDADLAVQMSGVTKRFGSFEALSGVDFEVAAGTVHALVGANGAGKSTCLGILAGRIPATSGAISVFGSDFEADSPRSSRDQGIATIYQELTIVPNLSSQANVFLGDPRAHGGWLDEGAMREQYIELCRQLGVEAHPDRKAGAMSVAEQQTLEIMRALRTGARLVLMDEPTASLARPERTALLNIIRELRNDGVTVVFVSHNLEEVLEIADNVTCFRDGELVSTRPAGSWTKRTLVEAMSGEPARVLTPPLRATPDVGAVVLEVKGLRIPGVLSEISFQVHSGEILGIAGLVGSGRSSVLRACAGMQPPSHGVMTIDGREVAWPRTPLQARRLGIALVPEDRKVLGLVPAMDAAENIVLSDYSGVSRRGVISQRCLNDAAGRTGRSVGFDMTRLRTAARNLSGGNQQKLLLARWAHSVPRVLLLDEPTRGIDVDAKVEILTTIQQMRAAGLAAVLVSSELEEVADTSDRVLVIRNGETVAVHSQLDRPVTASDLLQEAFDGRRAG